MFHEWKLIIAMAVCRLILTICSYMVVYVYIFILYIKSIILKRQIYKKDDYPIFEDIPFSSRREYQFKKKTILGGNNNLQTSPRHHTPIAINSVITKQNIQRECKHHMV